MGLPRKVHPNDDNDDYDSDDQSYAESGTQGGVDGSNGNDEHVSDLDFDLDISYDEYQQETLDMHWEVMAKTFMSEGEAYMFYNQKTTGKIFNHGRPDPQTETGESMFL
ncbi:putative LRR receptor-like serine/threonine-protein kinase [Hordeum vulgare]|nr:putative LRR receptor-like serine/threonine-protein kinase [Hordeum vulgare]